jgi:integrase
MHNEHDSSHPDPGGRAQPETGKVACQAYVNKLRQEKGEAAAKDAEGVFRRLIHGDPIGTIALGKLMPADVYAWRQRVLKRRSKTYANRCFTPVRAAFNYALARGVVPNDFAWHAALKAIKVDRDEGRRSLYLDLAERRLLLRNAPAELQPLLKSWTLLPVRPGDIAKLKVEHLDSRNRTLKIPPGKTASRTIPLTSAAFEHFRACAQGKSPGAWLVARAHGGPWDRFAWRAQMRKAVKAARLPAATVAYTVRHSVITDLVTAGVDLFTVARLAGTSIAMIDKYYGQLQQQHARDALEKLPTV